jgi:molecular chaperone HscB
LWNVFHGIAVQFKQTESDSCWQCGHASPHSLFCHYCDSIQAPTPDYFRFFGLEQKLDLDPDALQKRFYELSRQLHPDRYTRRSEVEKQYSLEGTAILNDAYRVLRDPVQRAEYVLKRNGFESTVERNRNVAPELLEEVFELNMAVEELHAGDESARPQLEAARDKFLGLRTELDQSLAEVFRGYDASPGKEKLEPIRVLLDRRKYIQNLVNQVETELAT